MIGHDLRKTLALFFAAATLGIAPVSTLRAADGATIAEQCAECHGRNGASSDSSIPIIGGYSVKYIIESLGNFRKKARACAEVTIQAGPRKGRKSDMCKVVADLSDEDARAVAKYLSAQKFVRAKQSFDAAKAKQGSGVYSLRCKKCHDDNGSSPDEDNGILAGQWTPYLRAQLEMFRAGKRPIDEKMKARLDRVSKDEEEALLHFFASQQ